MKADAPFTADSTRRHTSHGSAGRSARESLRKCHCCRNPAHLRRSLGFCAEMLSARIPPLRMPLRVGNGDVFYSSAAYVARQTTAADLAKIVREHAPAFFAELSEAGVELPAFVRKSFDAFGRCGSCGLRLHAHRMPTLRSRNLRALLLHVNPLATTRTTPIT